MNEDLQSKGETMTDVQLSPYSERIKALVDNSGKSLRKISLEIQKDIDPKFGIKNLQKILSRSGVEPRLSTLVTLANYFCVPLEYFIHGTISNEDKNHSLVERENTANILIKKRIKQYLNNTDKSNEVTDMVHGEVKKLNHKIRLKSLKEQLGFEFN